MGIHPELMSERAYIERAYNRLEEMRSMLRETLREAYEHERGGTPQSRAERDMVVRASLERLDRLDFGSLALCFGRIDQLASDTYESERFYIGRAAVSDSDMEPLVVDWRAPVAEPFYRATGRDPMGITLRRHFELRDRDLVGIEDEPFEQGVVANSERQLELSGPGALFFAIDRARTGRMGDIVATIQAEQDEIIRAPLPGVTVVQGGPGTGKTAVALHRAAYLLYTHRARLERQGVLVVAPNGAFARYIERVLPSLGETGVEIATLAGLVPTSATIRAAIAAEAKLKADPRMVAFVAKSISDRERPLARDAFFYIGSIQLVITREMSSLAVRRAKRRSGTHNERRRVVEAILLRQLARSYLDLSQRAEANFRALPPEIVSDGQDFSIPEDLVIDFVDPDDDVKEVLREIENTIRQDTAFQRVLQRIWARLTPEQLLEDLFSHEALCTLAGRGLLSDLEIRLLISTHQIGTLSRADVALLDEALFLLGPTKKKQGGEIRRFGHIVVDEAQELSHMEARVLARRSISSSMTLVGDLAQTTSAGGLRDWEKIVAPLRVSISEWTYRKLSVNYRTPSEIAELAYRLCDSLQLGLEPAVSIRSTGEYPSVLRVEATICASVLNRVRSELAQMTAGIIGIVAPDSEIDVVNQAVEDALRDSGLSQSTTVEVMTIVEAKGLEFDSVVVVGPTRLVADHEAAKAALFTAITRATKRVAILYEGFEEVLLADWGMLHSSRS